MSDGKRGKGGNVATERRASAALSGDVWRMVLDHASGGYTSCETILSIRTICRFMRDYVTLDMRIFRPSFLCGGSPAVLRLARSLVEVKLPLYGEVAPGVVRALGGMTQLRALKLTGDNTGGAIAALSALTGLRRLDVCASDLRPCYMSTFVVALRSMTLLEELDVSMCIRDGLGSERLFDAMLGLTGLERLHVSGNGLWEEDGYSMAAAVTRLTGLKALKMDSNNMGGEAIGMIGGLTRLTALDASGAFFEDVDRGDLAESLRRLTLLEDLALARIPLLYDSTEALHGSLSRLTRLRRLDVSGTSLGGLQGTAALFESLRSLTGLEELDVRCALLNFRRAEAIEAARGALGALTRLRELNLCGNRLGTHQAGSPVFALPPLPRLAWLDVSACRLGDRGGVALAQAIAGLPSLRTLRAAENAMGPAAGRSLLEALSSSPRLVGVDVASNGLGWDLAKRWDETFGRIFCRTDYNDV